MNDVAIQFFKGVDEKVIPKTRLTKAKMDKQDRLISDLIALRLYFQIILRTYRECI